MYTNYHAHTERCYHALGTEEEYINIAIKSGFSEFGFSDHVPYFLSGFYSDYRMEPERVNDYINTVNDLREKYADKIKIYLGFEMEYYPKHFKETLDYILKHDIDYIILGQHFINNEYDGVYVQSPSANKEYVLKRYVEQVIEAMQLGIFTYLAHPDVIMFDTKKSIYKTEMEKLCVEAKKIGLPLEINLTGLVYGRSYPNEDFFRLAADCGNEVIIGFDSHSPEAVFSPEFEEGYKKAVKMTEKLGLKLLERAELVKPKLTASC